MKEVNEKYSKQIYWNILKAIIVMTYFLTLNFAYENVRIEYMEIASKIITIVFLFIGIYIIEKAYKNDDGELSIQGIEVLILAMYTLTTKHVTNKFDFNFKSYSLVASYLYAIYFLLRSIFIYTKGRKEEVENLSDIREIVKKEEPVKKEAVKKKEKNESISKKEKIVKQEQNEKNKISRTNKTVNENKLEKTKNNTEKSKKTESSKQGVKKGTSKKTSKETKKVEKKKEEVKEND